MNLSQYVASVPKHPEIVRMENSPSFVARMAQHQTGFERVRAFGRTSKPRLPGLTFHRNVGSNLEDIGVLYTHINIVTFVSTGDPGDNDSARIVEARVSVADLEGSRIEGPIGADEAENVSGYHSASNDDVYAATPYFHTPTTDLCTPREHDTSIFHANPSEPDHLEKALVSYLLRHFKQGPGQWCASAFEINLKLVLTMTKDGPV